MSNVLMKDLKHSRFHVRSVYCSWKFFSDLNQNGWDIVRATVTPDFWSFFRLKKSIPLKFSLLSTISNFCTVSKSNHK